VLHHGSIRHLVRSRDQRYKPLFPSTTKKTTSHQKSKPETNNLLPGVPLESIHLLFAGNIVAGATRDTVPRFSRAKHLSEGGADEHYDDDDDDVATGKNGSMSSRVERIGDSKAKNAAYGMNNAGAA
jgi:hypothetical protein